MKKKFHVKKRLFWWNECYIFGQKWRYFTWNFFQIPLKIFLYVQTIYFKYWKHRLRSVPYAGKKIMSIRHVVQKISWKQKGRGKNCVISKILTPPLLARVIIWKFPPHLFSEDIFWTTCSMDILFLPAWRTDLNGCFKNLKCTVCTYRKFFAGIWKKKFT